MKNHSRPPEILVDGHVHVHDVLSFAEMLNAADGNFAAHQRSDDTQRVLLLTESAGVNRFDELYQGHNQAAEAELRADWSIERTSERESLRLVHRTGRVIFLIAGRQIVTRERLEVLAIATDAIIEDGLDMEQAVDAVKAAGGIPVLPWGFGKWTGRRGRIVHRYLTENEDDHLLLGDNGGRLKLWPEPPLFRFAREQGLGILPGTDTLPFDGEFRKVGRYGARLTGSLDADAPARDIRRCLTSQAEQMSPYGRIESLVPFVINQLRMQLHVRRRRALAKASP